MKKEMEDGASLSPIECDKVKNMDKWINKIHQGDTLELLKQMPDESVDMVLTSPPYSN